MNEQEIRQELNKLLKKIAPDTEPEKLQPVDNIRQTLMIDSFDFLRFIAAIDKQFGMETPEEDYGKVGTMEKLIAYISGKKK
jgi:acyl carrier protein